MPRINDTPENNLKELIELEKKLTIDKNDSYIISYHYILRWFKRIKKFNELHFVCGANMVYGWMPRIIHWHPNTSIMADGESIKKDFKCSADILSKVKNNPDISVSELKSFFDSDLKQLKQLVDNSLVASSKLFHFVAPKTFAIFDSNVCNYFFSSTHLSVKRYKMYIKRIKDMSLLPRCQELYNSVFGKVSDEISFVRAIELAIFTYETRPINNLQ